MGADTWAKRRSGASGSASASAPPADSEDGAGSEAPSASSDSKGVMSHSVASSASFEDDEDKFHLPADHQPLMLLQGWDRAPKPPEPPPPPTVAPAGPPGGKGPPGQPKPKTSPMGPPPAAKGAPPGGGAAGPVVVAPPPPPPPPPPGFSCQDCAYFRAHGNGGFGCENTDYQRWSGVDRLVETKSGRPVLDPSKASSDWFKPATGGGASKLATRHSS